MKLSKKELRSIIVIATQEFLESGKKITILPPEEKEIDEEVLNFFTVSEFCDGKIYGNFLNI